MNTKIKKTKKISAVLLATIIIAGIIALSFPSIMTGKAQAQPYFGMDNRYNSYGPIDYGMDNNDRKSYGNDNSYESQYQSYKPDYKPKYPSYDKKDDRDKSKDNSKSVDVKTIKCINTNLNINGNNAGKVSLGNKGAAEEGSVDAYSSSDDSGYDGDKRYYEGYNKKDKYFDCIINNNNNNTNVVGGANGNQTIPPEPSTASLSVSKTIKCTPSAASVQSACDAIIAGTGLPAGQITPNEFNIVVTGNNPNPSQFDGSTTPVVVTLGPGPYQVSDIGDPSVAQALFAVIAAFPGIVGSTIGPIPTFSGDCTQVLGNSQTATGTIAAGESQTCNIENAFIVNPVA